MDPLGTDVHIHSAARGWDRRVDCGGSHKGSNNFPRGLPWCVLDLYQLPVTEPSTGERVSNLEELPLNEYREYIKVQTDKGTEVATNLVIVCNGIKINSSAYSSAFGEWASNSSCSPSCLLSLWLSETPHSPCHLNRHSLSPPLISSAH